MLLNNLPQQPTETEEIPTDDRMQFFNNPEFGDVRTFDIDGVIWFVGVDVARALGYGKGGNLTHALYRHVEMEDFMLSETDNIKNGKTIGLINESGVFSLIISSKLPSAKKFKHWVTSEVLPSIRKHGAYMTPETTKKALHNPEK